MAYVAIADRDHPMHDPQTFIEKYVWSQDHKVIAIQYGSVAIGVGLVALVLSLLMRLQIGFPDTFSFITPYNYYQFVTMHGMIMVIYLLTALFLAALTPKFQANAFKVLDVGDLFADPRIDGLSSRLVLPENRGLVPGVLVSAFATRARDRLHVAVELLLGLLLLLHRSLRHAATTRDEVHEHAEERQHDDEEGPGRLPPAGDVVTAEEVAQDGDQDPEPDHPSEKDEHGPDDVEKRVVGSKDQRVLLCSVGLQAGCVTGSLLPRVPA